MPDVSASVLKLEQSPTRAGKARWLLGLSNGETVTIWDAPLADQANKIPAGATALFSYESKQNGQYTNHTLRSIVYTGPQAAPKAITEAPKGGGGMSAEDKERVTFLSLFSSVATIFSGAGSVDDAWAAAVGLQKRLFPKPEPQAEAVPVVAPEPAQQAESGIPWS